MKTAFELANSDKPFEDRLLDIQQYAKEVSEETLHSVLVRVKLKYSDFGYKIDIDSILNTPIVTP